MREISNLDLKLQLTNEYLRTGGVEKIFDSNLLQDLINIKFDKNGKADPNTVTPRANAFMLAILGSHSLPPLLHEEYISEYKSHIQKSLFFDQIKIEIEEQIDELFEKYKGEQNFLFRGQREAKWRLYSSLQRFWVWDKFKKEQKEYEDFLKNIVAKGKTEFSKEINEILNQIHIDSLNELAILGFLQHHNCPTPLLDWTYDFNNALFFGIDGIQQSDSVVEIDNYFSVYFIEEHHFGQGGMRQIMDESLNAIGEEYILNLIKMIASTPEIEREMIEKFQSRSFFDKEKLTGSGLISKMTEIDTLINFPVTYFSDKDISNGIAFSLYNSQNIIKQDGVFTWNNSFDKPLEVIGQEQYNEEKENSDQNDYRFSECYNISKSLEPYIRKKLENLGITSEMIYPDKNFDANSIYLEAKKEFL
ncbi:FRG domain-containing protein [Chryseobacterium gambrini]|uniref:FRG domain-containing protein n=1 Tax=Chryseobacterium gambrini TaxID=373672 RepID=UPI0022F405FA|nr:FRG domain-containing protein [Chryseobacterium gambrini]WBX98515.1 FRG domain-containing protein [Chryseobacterium gambrini]